jgi:hypothetical protein
MASNYIPEDTPCMTTEEYERTKREERLKDNERRAKKKIDDDLARERRKEQIKIQDKIEYTEELATEICERIAAGELLINICNDSHMPTVKRCNYWLKQNSDFNALFKDAINDRLTIFEEQTIAIADDNALDIKEIAKGSKTTKTVDTEIIQRAKLRVEVRFRHLKAGRPGKWGDTSTLITKSEDEALIDSMSLDELEKKISDLGEKNNIIKIVE